MLTLGTVPHHDQHDTPEGWRLHPSKGAVALAVARRLTPLFIEATVVPTALFYAVIAVSNLRWGFLAALAWSYTALLRRVVRSRGVPALLILTTAGLTMRTAVFLLSGNAVVYFLQPILGTVATAALFFGSVVAGRPFIARFADDFCPLESDVASRPAITGLFRDLTLLWGGVNLVTAAVNLTLLLTLPVPLFMGTKTVTAWIASCTGVGITVSRSVTTARSEGLETAVSPDRKLHAYLRPVPA